MKIVKYGIMSAVLLLVLSSWMFRSAEAKQSYKCLVQLINYTGEGAYMVTSVVGPDGYEKTLYVLGEDEKWYHDLTGWWTFFESSEDTIDGISGATISGGERTVFVLDIDENQIDAGFKLRFETAVENQKYFIDDLEIDLDSESIVGKFEGKGYIRYVRLIPN